jgi:hypothetical protein
MKAAHFVEKAVYRRHVVKLPKELILSDADKEEKISRSRNWISGKETSTFKRTLAIPTLEYVDGIRVVGINDERA